MNIQRNQTVRIIAGDHKGITGRVIRRPMGRDGITTVTGPDDRTFDVKAEELEAVATNGQMHQ